MGTRGLWGFRKNGEDKLTYNHYDSYPAYLGCKVIEFVKEHGKEELENIFRRIVLVDENDPATAEAMVLCKRFSDVGVSKGNIKDWYCLLRKSQGCPEAYADGLRFMVEYAGFIYNSLFCEYVYIINLDEDVLEYWVGFQREPDDTNRYGTEQYDGYYPCKKLKDYPLESIRHMDIDEITSEMNMLEDLEYQRQNKNYE